MKHLILAAAVTVLLVGCTPSPGEAYLADFKQLEAELEQLTKKEDVCFSEIEATMDKYSHLHPDNQVDFDGLFSEQEQARYDEIEDGIEAQLKKLRDSFNRDC